MFLHRVLPKPPTLSNADLAQRWFIERDPIQNAKTMPDKIPTAVSKKIKQIQLPPRPKASPPADEQPSSSPSQESLEDYESPKTANSEPRTSSKGHQQVPWQHTDTLEGVSPSSICLCQPDPKVPRPRNAFILYRQHYQASVVAQNPGLANPEISKVIGDHWRNSPEEVKAHWRVLAVEEKVRHQKQYPDYRYQPRRSGRQSSVSHSLPSPNATDSSPKRCPKCGGKSTSTSKMMSSVSYTSQTAPKPLYSPTHAIPTPNSTSSTTRFLRGLGSPPIHASPPQTYRFPSKPVHVSPPIIPPPRYKRPECSEPTPDPKRRRIANVTFAPARGPSGPQTPFALPTRHPSLPRLESLGPATTAHGPFALTPTTRPCMTMPPPPRPSSSAPQPHGHRPSTSLTLPPLHSPSTSTSTSTEPTSLRAMILSIPLLNKIRLLARIAPPLPPTPSRGLIIAIDAADPSALKALTRTLLAALEGCETKVFATPQLPAHDEPSFASYLRLVEEYHTLSAAVEDFVTARPSTPASSSSTSSSSPPPAPRPADGDPPLSPLSSPAPARTSAPGGHTAEADPPAPAGAMRIALLPTWHLTHTDAFACTVEIADRYSPIDHWQWGATVWRGVVGADVTVAVKAEAEAGAGNESPGPDRAKGGVEVRLEEEGGTVVVKGEGAGVGEGGCRRVGFEIGEWVRGWGERGGAGRRGS